MPLHHHNRQLARLAGAVCLLVGWAMAQVGSGVLTGRVTDVSGSAVPAAQVTITNLASGVAVKVGSNGEGLYRAPALVSGDYRVEVTANGFESAARAKLHLDLAQTVASDFELKIGAATQMIDVTADLLQLDTQSSSIGQLVAHGQIETLPVSNRAATSLINLSPGVVMINNGEGAENYPVFAVAGGRARNQDYTLDGGSVTNAVGVTRPQQQTSLPLDAMEEFRVITNNYSAEYGHSTGGVIALSTRSGTNEFHGSVFEFARNNALDARNFFAVAAPPLNLHQFGGSLGGPIAKNRTHFFVSWEQTREVYGSPVLSTVPTLNERAGNFAGVGATIYDPTSLANGKRTPFANNVVPAAAQDPVAVKALAYYPVPNRTPSAGIANNYSANSHSSLHRDIAVVKLDHSLGARDQLTARYYINDYTQQDDGSYRIPVADPSAGTTDGRVQSALVSALHTFSPTVVNNFSLSYDRRAYIQQRQGIGEGLAQSIGLSGVTKAAFPTFNVNGYAWLGALGTTNAAVARIQTPIVAWQATDAVSIARGKHALKLGFDYRHGYNRETDDTTSSGNLVFTRQITGQPGVSGTGDAFASLLTGQVNAASFLNSDTIATHAAYWAGFAQDDYRVTKRFTLNFGLRWETELPRTADANHLNSFDPTAINPVSGTPGVVTFAGLNGVSAQSFRTRWNNWAPRVGFAYNAPWLRNLVVRGGAGVFYGPTVSTSVGPQASLGFVDSLSLVAPNGDTGTAITLRNGFPAYTRPALNASYGAVAVGAKPTTAVSYFAPDRPTPVSYQFNLNVQNEVRGGVVVESGYIGNVGHHLTAADMSVNQVPSKLLTAGNLQSLRPFPQFSNVSLINPPVGDSSYHAGYIKAERRFASGLAFLAHYTFSKYIDNAASATEFGDPGTYMDAYNRRLDKGLSGSDIPQRLVASVLYTTPKLKAHRTLARLAGDWQLGLLATLQSGQTFTVYDSVNRSNSFSAGTMRPNLIADPRAGTQSLSHWFNTAAFQTADAYTFGNAPRSVLRGPAWKTVDATIARSFALTERWRTELRGEFFNALNHANFDIPGHTLGNADFGVINSAQAARTVQVALRVMF